MSSRDAGSPASLLASLKRRLGESWHHAWRWPLLLPALGALSGITLADHLRWLPGWGWVGIGVLLSVLLAALVPGRVRWCVIAAWALGGFACLHQHSLTTFDQQRAELEQLLPPGQPQAAQLRLHVTGMVIDAPLELSGTTERWSVPVRSEQWQDLRSSVKSSAPVRFRVRFEGPPPAYGDRIRLTGQFRLPAAATHPWQRDPQQAAERRGVVGDLQVRGPGAWQRLQPDQASWWKARALASRAWVERQLEHGMERRPERVGVVKAMVLGLKREAPSEIEAAFRHSGSLHLFAVSGLHVGMVGLIAAMVLQFCGVSVRQRTLAIAAVALTYAFVTGWSPSAARASIMLAVVMTGLRLERPTASLNSLSVAVLLLLVVDTQRLFQIGFQLSCMVVAGILIGAGWFQSRLSPLAEPDPFLPRSLITPWGRRWWKVRRWILGLAAMSAAAWLASAPLMWFHFSLLTPSGLAANLVLVPLGFVVMSAASATMITGLIPLPLAWLQLVANHIAVWTGATLAALAGFFSGLPGGSFYVAWPPQPPAILRAADKPVRIDVMEPGFGGGAALLQNGRRAWLLDIGSTVAWNPVTDRLLARRGINRIDGIWLSHGDTGHAGGLAQVFDWRRVDKLWAPPMDLRSAGGRLAAGMEEQWWAFEAGESRSRPSVTVHRLHSGDVVDGSGRGWSQPVQAHVLHPPVGLMAANADDGAMAVRFDIGPWRMLWMNDAGWNTEAGLIERWPAEQLAADLVLKGWHGSDDSGVDAFWQAVSPRVVVLGQPGPREGRGRERLLRLWQRGNVAVFDQTESGHVRIDLGPGRMEVRGWLDQRERVFER